MRPFRFGVNVRTAVSGVEWADKARRVEVLGYAVLLVPDHLAELLAPFPALAAAAAATTRLRIGTAVLNNDFRHPVLLAREAATVDVLSDGRLELGIGAGHMQSEYEEAGLGFDPGATRVERLAEAVAMVKRLLEGETVTFAGGHYRVTGHTIHPRPVQRPRPPIFIGGSAPRLLRVAARAADVVGLTGIAFRRGAREVDVADFRAAVVD
jgi:probable F420-dependent oxidoreductase